MARLFIVCMVIITCGMGTIYAQPKHTRTTHSLTHKTFNTHPVLVNIRDFIHLDNDALMVVELNKVEDYDRLYALDSILEQMYGDIAFYNDSLKNALGSVRIDYFLREDKPVTEMRFKVTPPEGDIYARKAGQLARLKVEHDTISIKMLIKEPERLRLEWEHGRKSKYPYTPSYSIQVTLTAERFSDVGRMLTRERLKQIVDTMKATKKEGTIKKPAKDPSSTIYRPFSQRHRFYTYKGIVKSEATADLMAPTRYADQILIDGSIGAGLVRNTLAPMAEAGISLYKMRRPFYDQGADAVEYNTVVTLSVSPYFFFDRDEHGNHLVKDNWFVNLYMGGTSPFRDGNTTLVTGGVGYLFAPKGGIFTGPTYKALMGISLKSGIRICPEIIFTNNFRQIFPGITIKVL